MASEHLVAPKDVFSTIEKLLLRDGFDIVIDMENSKGSHVIDSVTGTDWLDFYTFFASAPFGMNHPKLDNEEFKEKIFRAAINKVANSDIYTQEMADFVKTFGEVAVPEGYNHVFFIDYGTLAVENTFKVAMDWKVQKLIQKGKITPGEAFDGRKGTKIMHFNEAFHGRSGYTLSVTNTNDPNKHQRYAKFTEWPRIINPKITFPLEEHLGEVEWLEAQAIKQIKNALMNDPDGIAAVIIETIQGEGGDNHSAPSSSSSCARYATRTKCSSSSTRCSAAWASRARCGPGSTTRQSSPTSSPSAKRLRYAASSRARASTRSRTTASRSRAA